MNREWVLHHLNEAQRAIRQTIADIEATPDYDYGEYWVDMQHIYHHVNTAWNARDAARNQVENASPGDFNRWSEFPADLPMMHVEG